MSGFCGLLSSCRSFTRAAGQSRLILAPQSFLQNSQFRLDRHLSSMASIASVNEAPITINKRLYRTVKEGKATILAPYQTQQPKSAKNQSTAQSGQPRNNDEGDQAVFYNPIQQYNRDLSVLAILVYGESAIALKRARHDKNLQKDKRKKKQKLPAKSASSTSAVADVITTRDNFVSTECNNDEFDIYKKADEALPDAAKGTENAAPLKRKIDDSGLDTDLHDDAAKRPRMADETSTAVSKDNNATNLSQVTKISLAKHLTNGIESKKTPLYAQFNILDALSASGLRAIRYAHEIPFSTTVVANDLLPEAVEAITLNIEHNGLKDRVYANTGDARQFMYSKTGNEAPKQAAGYVHKFDVVDLDPYGTAAPFIDAALQAVVDGGLLCVTCTDAGVWASNGYPEKAYALYGGTPMKGAHSHEAGLRLILHSIAASAARYGLAIEPLLSLSIDFYGRLFVRVHRSQRDVKLLAGTTMIVYNCDQGCGAWQTQLIAKNSVKKGKNNEEYFKHGFAQAPSVDKYCEHCGTKMHIGGPMWAGPIHNPSFIRKILNKLPSCDKTIYGTTERIKGMLTVALEEENIAWPPETPTTIHEHEENTAERSNAVTAISTSGAEDEATIIPRMPPELLSPTPFFFLPTYLAKMLSLPTPAEDPFRGAFLAMGYSCSRSHCKPGSFKTNAPWKVIWEVLREWARQKEADRLPRLFGEGEFADKGSVKRTSPGWPILRRIRGRQSEALAVSRIRDRLLEHLRLGKSSVTDCSTASDLRTVLKGALYETEHLDVEFMPHSRTRHGNEQDESIENDHGAATTDEDPARISGKSLIDTGADVSDLEITFDTELGRAFRESAGKLVRYQMNPRANWGPMIRAGGGNSVSHIGKVVAERTYPSAE